MGENSQNIPEPAQTPQTPLQDPTEPTKQMNTKIFFLALMGVFMTVLTVGAALHTQIWDPVWNPFRANPTEVLADTLENTKNLKTYRAQQKVDLSFQAEEGNIKVSITTGEILDQTNLIEKNTNIDFSLSVTATELEYADDFDMSLDGTLRMLGSTFYGQLTSLSLPPDIKAELNLEVPIDDILNKWVKFDVEEFVESTLLGQEADFVFEEQLEKQKELLNAIRDITFSPELYTVVEELSDEKIGGKSAHHYIVRVDVAEMAEQIISAFIETNKDELKAAGEGQLFTMELLAGAAKGMIEAFLEKTGDLTGEVWIDKKTRLPLAIKIEKTLDLRILDDSIPEGTILSFVYEITYSAFDEPVSIEPPEESIDLIEMLEPFMGQFMGMGNPDIAASTLHSKRKSIPFHQPQPATLLLILASKI